MEAVGMVLQIVAGTVIEDIIKNEVAVFLIVRLLLNLRMVVQLHIVVDEIVHTDIVILIHVDMITLVIVMVIELGMV